MCVCLIVYDLETSTMSRPTPDVGYCTTDKITRTLATLNLSRYTIDGSISSRVQTRESSSVYEVPPASSSTCSC